jgi:hypothetical protein
MHTSWLSQLCCVLLSGPLFRDNMHLLTCLMWLACIGCISLGFKPKPKPNKLSKSSAAVEAQYTQGHRSLDSLGKDLLFRLECAHMLYTTLSVQ